MPTWLGWTLHVWRLGVYYVVLRPATFILVTVGEVLMLSRGVATLTYFDAGREWDEWVNGKIDEDSNPTG